jgi:Domain of unknown function (DUF4349)/Putative zinc-finger
MNTTAHPVAPEQVMALLDDELSASDAQAVSAHVEQCGECAQLANQIQSTSHSLSRWSIETVPGKLENSITALARESGSKIGKANLFIRTSFWTWKQWATASAGTLAVLLLIAAISLPTLYRSRQFADSYRAEGSANGRAGKPQVVTQLATPGEFTDQKSGVPRDKLAPPNSPVASASPVAASDSDGQPLTDQQGYVVSSPMIARTVSLSVVVKDFAAARASLDSILARRHGYSAQLNVSTPENAARGLQASLRIPALELASAIADLKTLGRVENESQSGEEVTEQHADLVARLKNSRETEQRLRTILDERTGKVTEVLQVEQEIARVRGDIERMEAEQKALEHRVDFATVELQLTEEFKAQLNPPAPSVSTRIHNAFVAGYRDASETVLGIALFFAEDGPTLLIWLAILVPPAFFLWRRYRKTLANV